MTKTAAPEHEEHEPHEPLHGINTSGMRGSIRRKVIKHINKLDHHLAQSQHHDNEAFQHHQAIDRIHGMSLARHNLANSMRRVFGKPPTEHSLSSGHKRQVAKHEAKINHHEGQVEHHKGQIEKHHGEIDTLVDHHAHRQGFKLEIRKAFGLHASDLLKEATNERENQMSEPEIITATIQIKERLSNVSGVSKASSNAATADQRATIGSVYQPTDTGHTFLRTPNAVTEHLMTHFDGRIKCGQDKCSGKIDTSDLPAMMEYMSQKGWKTKSKSLTSVTYKHPSESITLVLDYVGPESGQFWVY